MSNVLNQPGEVEATAKPRAQKNEENAKKGSDKPAYIKFYALGEPIAHSIKAALQMAIGLLLVILLIVQAVSYFVLRQFFVSWLPIIQLHALQLVSHGLAYSAGVELCYMLYTPGPDEALEPVILGIAAYILFVISDESTANTAAEKSLLIATSALSIGLLFYVRREFIKKP